MRKRQRPKKRGRKNRTSKEEKEHLDLLRHSKRQVTKFNSCATTGSSHSDTFTSQQTGTGATATVQDNWNTTTTPAFHFHLQLSATTGSIQGHHPGFRLLPVLVTVPSPVPIRKIYCATLSTSEHPRAPQATPEKRPKQKQTIQSHLSRSACRSSHFSAMDPWRHPILPSAAK